jgi:hypothetical protein
MLKYYEIGSKLNYSERFSTDDTVLGHWIFHTVIGNVTVKRRAYCGEQMRRLTGPILRIPIPHVLDSVCNKGYKLTAAV